jgi:hypothetical protein
VPCDVLRIYLNAQKHRADKSAMGRVMILAEHPEGALAENLTRNGKLDRHPLATM